MIQFRILKLYLIKLKLIITTLSNANDWQLSN